MNGLNIKIRDLVKVHHTGKIEVQALRGLNLDISSGELVSIIGPSGSGKSTLLNIVGGLDKATAGTVQVGEKTVTALSVRQLVDYRRKMVGHIFQNLNLIPTLSAQENIEFSMVASGVARGKRKAESTRTTQNSRFTRTRRPQTRRAKRRGTAKNRHSGGVS